jgi:hypothetical protein
MPCGSRGFQKLHLAGQTLPNSFERAPTHVVTKVRSGTRWNGVLTILVRRHSVEPTLPTQEARARASISGKQVAGHTHYRQAVRLDGPRSGEGEYSLRSPRSIMGSTESQPHPRRCSGTNAPGFPSLDLRHALPTRIDQGRGWNASLPYWCGDTPRSPRCRRRRRERERRLPAGDGSRTATAPSMERMGFAPDRMSYW